MRGSLLLLVAIASGAACKSGDLQDAVPARIDAPTPASRAALKEAVADMLHGTEVLLADDALTASSVLSIERRSPQGIDVPPAGGRELGRPEQFRLLLLDGECVLLHAGSDARRTLRDTHCVPE